MLGEGLSEVLSTCSQGSIAVASMASGGGGVEPARIARILVGAARRYFEEHPRSPLRVVFCLPNARDYEAFAKAIGSWWCVCLCRRRTYGCS